MTAPESLYGVLGVAASADSHELKRAYRRMQRFSHPDTGGSAEHFRTVQEAWAVLGHPERRADYDRSLRGASDHRRMPEHPARPRAQHQAPQAQERQRVRRADHHGHPGGSARLKYLELLRAWLLNPTPPSPPSPRTPFRKARGMFVRRWARLCVHMVWTFAVGGAGVALFFGWRAGLLQTAPEGLWIAVAAVAGLAALSGAISSVPMAILRMLRDPYRRELIRFRREKARQHATEQADYRSALRDFESTLRGRPANAEALLAAPFSEDAVREASAAIRGWLDKAIAQENTARVLAPLGPDFSIWHDLEVGAGSARIDHLLVGPQGLILIESLTATGPVSVEFDALVQGGRPMTEVLESLRPRIVTVGRALGIAGISAAVLVCPDSLLVDAQLQRLGGSPVPTFVVGASLLAEALVRGLPRIDEGASWQIDRLRESVAERVRFAQ